jgi:cytochrome c553
MNFPHWIAATILLAALPAAAQDAAGKPDFCASCHGIAGLPHDTDVPIIWGQQAGYLEKQLRDYRAGDRDNQIMSSIAESLTDADIAALSTWFANQPWPTPAPSATAATTPCGACHQVPAVAGMPRLAGQQPAYLQTTMQEFANGTRANSPLMTALLKPLKPEQRAALATALGQP